MTTAKLSSLAVIVRGYPLQSDLFSDDSSLMPVARSQDFHDGVPGKFTHETIRDNKFIVQPGDILVSLTIELMVTIWKGPAAYLSEQICKVEPKDNQIRKNYLYHLLSKKTASLRNLSLVSELINLSIDDLGNIEIEFPEIGIQEQIAHVLDMARRILNNRFKSNEILNGILHDSYIYMFGDPANNPRQWPLLKLSDMGIVGHKAIMNSKKVTELPDGDYPLLGIEQILKAGMYLKRDAVEPKKIATKREGVCPRGTLCIITSVGSVRVTILDFDAAVPGNVITLLLNERTNSKFVYFWFLYFIKILFQQAPGYVRKSISEKMLRDLEIICPDITLQNVFSQLVERIESIKGRAHSNLIESVKLYRSLLQRTSSGELAQQIEWKKYLEAGLPLKEAIEPPQQIEIKKPFVAQHLKLGVDEENDWEEKKHLGEDPLSLFSKHSDFDEDITEDGSLTVLDVVSENNIQEFSISSLRESAIGELELRGLGQAYERQITDKRLAAAVNKMIDKFLLHELLDQPFTFQQLRQVLSTVNFKPDFYILDNYIFNRLQEDEPLLKQAYFNEQMVNVNPFAYQYLLDTMDTQLMGDQVITPSRRLYLVFSLPKIKMPDAASRT